MYSTIPPTYMRRISVISFHFTVGAIRCEFRRAPPEAPMVDYPGKITPGFFISHGSSRPYPVAGKKENPKSGTSGGSTDLKGSQENVLARMAGALDPDPPSDR